jgi:hypothetical protein
MMRDETHGERGIGEHLALVEQHIIGENISAGTPSGAVLRREGAESLTDSVQVKRTESRQPGTPLPRSFEKTSPGQISI